MNIGWSNLSLDKRQGWRYRKSTLRDLILRGFRFLAVLGWIGQMVFGIPVPTIAAPDAICPTVTVTSKFSIAYGDALYNSAAAPPGSIVTAKSPRGDVVGCFVVTTIGKYGAMYIYGEDTSVSPGLPGMRTGEQVAFYVNNTAAVATPVFYWMGDKDLHEIDLVQDQETISGSGNTK
jgi:hypothetical protein